MNAETNGALVAPKDQLPATSEYEQFAGGGLEGARTDMLKLPFIAILQGLSPQITKGLIAGAKVGDIVNTVTNELYAPKPGINFIVSYTKDLWTEWLPNRGGLVDRHEHDSDVVKTATHSKSEFGADIYKTLAGNDLVRTIYVYGLVVEYEADGKTVASYFPAVISFSVTKMKVWSAWYTRLHGLKLRTSQGLRTYPTFAHVFTLGSTLETSKKSKKDYMNWTVPEYRGGSAEAARLSVKDQLFQEAFRLGEAIKAGTADASMESEGNQGSTEHVGNGDEEIPF
jgi:hypothetical protein